MFAGTFLLNLLTQDEKDRRQCRTLQFEKIFCNRCHEGRTLGRSQAAALQGRTLGRSDARTSCTSCTNLHRVLTSAVLGRRRLCYEVRSSLTPLFVSDEHRVLTSAVLGRRRLCYEVRSSLTPLFVSDENDLQEQCRHWGVL